jgi:hypothetical protein
MDHEPRGCSQEDWDSADLPQDNHSGSRLVLLLMLLPLAVFAGWIGYSVVRELARTLLDPIMAQRLSYVAGGLAMLGMTMIILRWQSALSPRAQAQADDLIDDMDEQDRLDDDEAD